MNTKHVFTLDNLKIGRCCRIISINNEESIRRRLLDLGLIPGTIIEAVLESPFKDPVAYKIKNATIAIRKCDSKNIIVEELE